jgi:hypothetical protein
MNQLPVSDEIVAWLAMALIIFAACVNLRAARFGLTRFRMIHTATATLAFIYVAGYLWLLLGDANPMRWSSVFRGVSLIVWPVVWAWPAWESIVVHRELRDAVQERLEDER